MNTGTYVKHEHRSANFSAVNGRCPVLDEVRWGSMKIEVLYFKGCPNYIPAVDRLKAVLRQQGLSSEVSVIEVRDESAAKALQFFGSPTIRVNGFDLEADSRNVKDTGFACRRYPGGLPSEEMIRTALREAGA
jgi:hypothetical protein